MNIPTITYPVSEWENYAWLHAKVTTSFQLAVYKEACKFLSGEVVDCGCGSAKIAPLLAENNKVFSYTGIDYAESMVNVSRWVLKQLERPSFSIKQCKIEELEGKENFFSSGVSIQSYYSWPAPIQVLNHIYKILKNNATFILATPNKSLSIESLIKESEQELIAHPDFEAFKEYNLQLAENTQANFIEMDSLISQVQKVGFMVQECHQNHFSKGLNFLVLKKQ